MYCVDRMLPRIPPRGTATRSLLLRSWRKIGERLRWTVSGRIIVPAGETAQIPVTSMAEPAHLRDQLAPYESFEFDACSSPRRISTGNDDPDPHAALKPPFRRAASQDDRSGTPFP